jgi:DNA-binding YbaB/EbfC family protein
LTKPPLDLTQMMQQAQELSAKLQDAQQELRHRRVEATVGGGVITATVNGASELVEIRIDPVAVDPRDVEMLQDLILAAVNEGVRRAQELAREELQRRTGLPIGAIFGALGQR